MTYYNVSMDGQANGATAATITGANTFNNLTIAIAASANLAGYTINANQTINGIFTVT